jgi:beta-galactosidase
MPLLCSVTAELQAGGRIVHRQSSGFGFRWFRFDPEKGFFLNGQPFKLRGTVYTKTAVGPFADRAALWKNEIGLLKGMGIRFVRPAEGGIA